jgi:adenylate cyclase
MHLDQTSEQGEGGELKPGAASSTRMTLWQRMALRKLKRQARKGVREPLSPADWGAFWDLNDTAMARVTHRLFHLLPSSPRCGICSAPFAGAGGMLVRPLGYRPSRKNPTLCATCVELSPPGGMKMQTGILFADLRGFTASSERADPESVSKVLRRFYRCAEDVLFPDALIDKLIGDQVMALYLPDVQRKIAPEQVPDVMVGHARGLLRAVGYGEEDGPFVEVGIGIDIGEAFVGNIGERALYDFTAVGDVVNTAARLQGQAAAGEIVLSKRLADRLSFPAGTPVELELKGKTEPQVAYRLRIDAATKVPVEGS